ncbi:MAG: hypothetical protein QOI36_2055, partial [Pseudonocardiales bacterium]|nr:hypothetical protein [Pseudonocardiales bacterium]
REPVVLRGLEGLEQWIHTDPERARKRPFGATVQHGFLTLGYGHRPAVAPLLRLREARSRGSEE